MKIFILTDLEGCAGVMDARGYIWPDSPHYREASELLTLEVSAAVAGALDAGATEVLVVDAHGPGAIRRSLLHPRARLLGGRPVPPNFTWCMDGSFAAAMIVGQHAMSNTDGGHIAHTMSFAVEEYLLNDNPVGEAGLVMLLAGYFGVPTILLTGDAAACEEARALVPNIETVAVKEGLKRGSARGLTAEENERYNSCAIHIHPDQARSLIREHACKAVQRIADIAPFHIEPPYTLRYVMRPEPRKKTGTVLQAKAGDYLDLLALPPKRVRAVVRGAHRKTEAPSTPAKKPIPQTSSKTRKTPGRKKKAARRKQR